ncbi:hypothetical protein [Streptacidiphilus sp. MAP5-3]|uniref:hypothetical protein n=1 Tax=unclassified Streptacidiphilus TaxID=2643834 RepID=UPI003519752A
MSSHRVIVYGIESGPGHPVGRPVEVDGRDVGVAADLADLWLLLEEHGVFDTADVEWRDGGPDHWESAGEPTPVESIAPIPAGQFESLLRRARDGDLPRCPRCGRVPTAIEFEGAAGRPMLRFRPCGHRVE